MTKQAATTTEAAAVAEQGATTAPEQATSTKGAKKQASKPAKKEAKLDSKKASKKDAKPAAKKEAKPASKKTAKGEAGASVPREFSKKAIVIDLMRRKEGATMAEIAKTTEWQNHSIRGFISGNVTKKMGLKVESTKNEAGERVYRITSK